MALRLYNSLTRQLETFEPIHEGRVGLYVCGPTVWNESHLGHGKTYVNFDTVLRYLRFAGYNVLYVQNVTDVGHLRDSGEDRILAAAKQEQTQPMALAETYTRHYFRDMDALNVTRPDISPRASGHIPEQIELVKVLIERGFAYEVNGSVYFSVRKFQEYGKLSGRKVEELIEGARVEVLPEKRDPADFALWKRADPEHIMQWPSPWGLGYPGWHIECSAMSTKYLGQPFDIHGGGLENKFPHHESEVAQSEAAFGRPFARYWLHNGMLMIRGGEMHKSLGNFITLQEAFKKWPPMVIRFYVLGCHYRNPLDMTEEALDAARKGLDRLYTSMRRVRSELESAGPGPASPEMAALVEETRSRFRAEMDDDFNTAAAIGALFDSARKVNATLHSGAPQTADTWKLVDDVYTDFVGSVLGLITDETFASQSAGMTEQLLKVVLDTRADLRRAKQYALADQVRQRLAQVGVQLEDKPEGTSWRIVPQEPREE